MVMPSEVWCMMPTAAIYEQLAEECAELGHVALKMARIMRGENPTPADVVSVMRAVKEEFTDVKLVADVIGLSVDDDILQKKLERWYKRLKERDNND